MITLLAFLPYLCVDIVLEDVQLSPEQKQMQKMLMQTSFSVLTGGQWNHRVSNFIRTDTDPDNECLWRGVRCTGGVLHTFVCNKKIIGENRALHMSWLPSTLAFVHMTFIDLAGPWKACELPRTLRYMYMSNCYMNQHWLQVKRHKNFQKRCDLFIDLRRLPLKLEEFCLYNSWWAGPVHITDLPRLMRLLYIVGSLTHPTYVENKTLPEGLQEVIIEYDKKTSNEVLISAKNETVDQRVKIGIAGNSFRKKSRFYEFFSGVNAEIRQELLNTEPDVMG